MVGSASVPAKVTYLALPGCPVLFAQKVARSQYTHKEYTALKNKKKPQIVS